MAATVADLCRFLEAFAPPYLAEDWDNVGLLVGDHAAVVGRVMTCLTLTHSAVAEAVREQAHLVVVHHPLPFKPIKRITTETTPGRLLLELIRGGVAVYSPHTAFDSAADGINAQLASCLGLTNVQPLIPHPQEPAGPGTGRIGELPSAVTLAQLAERTKTELAVPHLQCVGPLNQMVRTIAVGCGSAGSLLEAAVSRGCNAFITGEANLHTCYEAQGRGIGLILAGHYATERFHLEHLAEVLQREFRELEVWASRDETDPLMWL